jgi:peptidyl-prolyl cis-trans isomerase D
MLQKMRVYAKSWIAYIFVVPLIVSFGVWGIGDILRGGSADTSVASVGDVKITPDQFQREYRNIQRRESAQAGHILTSEEARAKGIDRRLLNDEIASSALDQAASHYALIASDARVSAIIRSQSAFRNPLGTFDRTVFEQVLQNNDLTEQTYVALIRGELTRNQILVAAASGVVTPPGYAKMIFEYGNQHRTAEFVQISQKNLAPTTPPTDAQLSAFLKAHATEFSTPEYRDVTYLSVGPDDVANQLNVTDAELKQRYDALKDQYQIPEKRDVEQIIFSDQASAKLARAKIDAGTSFEDVAKAAGKSPTDIKLGSLQQADLGPDRGPPTFALSAGGVTQPIKFTFGWVLLHVTSITPAVNKTFDQVKATLRDQVVQQLAGAKISDITNEFEDARAGGMSFADAAKKVGMRVIHIPAVDRKGLAPDGSKVALPTAPEFQSQFAKAEVGEEGDPFATADGHAYAISVNGVTPTKLKSLESVRAQATTEWLEQQHQQQLAKLAVLLAQKANTSHSLAEIAAELSTTVQQSGTLTRKSTSPVLSPVIVGKIFAAAPGSAVFAPGVDGESYIVARVTGVAQPPVPVGDPRYAQFTSQIGETAGSDLDYMFANAWRDKLGYSINQSQFERLAGGS